MSTFWMDDALCAEVGPEFFFPEETVYNDAAFRICADCPVISECLNYALENEIDVGVWGGQTPNGRRRMLKERAG